MKVIAGERKMPSDGLEREGAELSGFILALRAELRVAGRLYRRNLFPGCGHAKVHRVHLRSLFSRVMLGPQGPGRTWFGQFRPPAGPLLKCTQVSIQLTELAGDCQPTGVDN